MPSLGGLSSPNLQRRTGDHVADVEDGLYSAGSSQADKQPPPLPPEPDGGVEWASTCSHVGSEDMKFQ